MNDKEEVNLAKIINLLDRSITIAIQARENLPGYIKSMWVILTLEWTRRQDDKWLEK